MNKQRSEKSHFDMANRIYAQTKDQPAQLYRLFRVYHPVYELSVDIRTELVEDNYHIIEKYMDMLVCGYLGQKQITSDGVFIRSEDDLLKLLGVDEEAYEIADAFYRDLVAAGHFREEPGKGIRGLAAAKESLKLEKRVRSAMTKEKKLFDQFSAKLMPEEFYDLKKYAVNRMTFDDGNRLYKNSVWLEPLAAGTYSDAEIRQRLRNFSYVSKEQIDRGLPQGFHSIDIPENAEIDMAFYPYYLAIFRQGDQLSYRAYRIDNGKPIEWIGEQYRTGYYDDVTQKLRSLSAIVEKSVVNPLCDRFLISSDFCASDGDGVTREADTGNYIWKPTPQQSKTLLGLAGGEYRRSACLMIAKNDVLCLTGYEAGKIVRIDRDQDLTQLLLTAASQAADVQARADLFRDYAQRTLRGDLPDDLPTHQTAAEPLGDADRRQIEQAKTLYRNDRHSDAISALLRYARRDAECAYLLGELCRGMGVRSEEEGKTADAKAQMQLAVYWYRIAADAGVARDRIPDELREKVFDAPAPRRREPAGQPLTGQTKQIIMQSAGQPPDEPKPAQQKPEEIRNTEGQKSEQNRQEETRKMSENLTNTLSESDRQKIKQAYELHRKGQYMDAMETFIQYGTVDGDCANQLGYMFSQGLGVAKNDEKACYWYEIGARLGNIYSQYNLATRYRIGNTVEKNPERAFELYQASAEQGDPDAMYQLAQCFEKGFGTAKDEKKAVEWYRKAIDAGRNKDYFSIAYLLAEGSAAVKDEKEAIKYYLLAAEKEDSAAAYCNLGHHYETGRGTEINPELAVKYYTIGIEKGSRVAARNLGDLYEKGKFVAKDLNKALELFEKAEKAGDEPAKKRVENVRAQLAKQQNPTQQPGNPQPQTKTAERSLRDLCVEQINSNACQAQKRAFQSAVKMIVPAQKNELRFETKTKMLTKAVFTATFPAETDASVQYATIRLSEFITFPESKQSTIYGPCNAFNQKQENSCCYVDEKTGTVTMRTAVGFGKESCGVAVLDAILRMRGLADEVYEQFMKAIWA